MEKCDLIKHSNLSHHERQEIEMMDTYWWFGDGIIVVVRICENMLKVEVVGWVDV